MASKSSEEKDPRKRHVHVASLEEVEEEIIPAKEISARKHVSIPDEQGLEANMTGNPGTNSPATSSTDRPGAYHVPGIDADLPRSDFASRDRAEQETDTREVPLDATLAESSVDNTIENLRREIEARERAAENIIHAEAVNEEESAGDETPTRCMKAFEGRKPKLLVAVMAAVVVAGSVAAALVVSLRGNDPNAAAADGNAGAEDFGYNVCYPLSDDPDIGILSCGPRKYCRLDENLSKAMGFCTSVTTACDNDSVVRSKCNCTLFDSTTAVGTITCRDEYCIGSDIESLSCKVHEQEMAYNANGTFSGSAMSCWNMPSYSVCGYANSTQGAGDSCAFSVSDVKCRSCSFDDYGCVTIDCTNTPKNGVVGKYCITVDLVDLFPALDSFNQ